MITVEQWANFNAFRTLVESEYTRSVLGKPERIPAYDETIGVLKDAIDLYAIDRTDPEQVYCTVAGLISALSFISQYFHTVCSDQHMMGHLSEAGTFLGYLVRELCYVEGAPAVTA